MLSASLLDTFAICQPSFSAEVSKTLVQGPYFGHLWLSEYSALTSMSGVNRSEITDVSNCSCFTDNLRIYQVRTYTL